MKLEDLMVIDWDRKGNVCRFYLGKKDLKDYWGDDWNDIPYEHNAGTVYDEFISGYIDMAWPYDSCVMEPCNGCCNSAYSKNMFKKREVPVIAVRHIDGEPPNSWEYERFTDFITNVSEKIYLGDSAETLLEKGDVVIIVTD